MLIALGVGAEGEQVTRHEVAALTCLELEGSLAKRRDRILSDLQGEYTGDAYCGYVGVALQDALSPTELDEMLKMVRSPVFQKWLQARADREAVVQERREEWRRQFSLQFIRRFSTVERR